MKIALVADQLANCAGAEKVFAVMCDAFPEADCFTSVYVPETAPAELARFSITELARGFHSFEDLRRSAALVALQMLRHSFDGYDVVLTSGQYFCRYIRAGRAIHVAYTYYPFRMIYDPERYGRSHPVIQGSILPALRAWDRFWAARVDRFLAISRCTQTAIRRCYGRDSEIIFAPLLNCAQFAPVRKDDFFLLVSRLEPWKRLEVAIDAFNALSERLVVIGEGPQRQELEARANRNVTFFGRVSEKELSDHYRRARALIQPTAIEFGLTGVEANACGTPAIALGVDGARETLVSYDDNPDRASALFYDEPTASALAAAVRRFRRLSFDPAMCVRNAARFSPSTFQDRLRDYVDLAVYRRRCSQTSGEAACREPQ